MADGRSGGECSGEDMADRLHGFLFSELGCAVNVTRFPPPLLAFEFFSNLVFINRGVVIYVGNFRIQFLKAAEIEFVNFFLRKGSLKSKLVERELDICAVRKIQPRKNFTCPLKIDDAYFARGIFFYEVD